MGKTYLQGEILTALDLNASLSEAVNTNGWFVFAGKTDQAAINDYPFMSGEHVHNAKLTANGYFVVNTYPSSFLSGSYFSNTINVMKGDVTTYFSNVVINYGNISVSGGYINVNSGGVMTSEFMFDKIGHVRRIPLNSISSNYSLVLLDAGKVINLQPGTSIITVNPNIFTAGDTITIWNGANQDVTLQQGTSFTMYWAGQNGYPSGNRTLNKGSFSSLVFLNSAAAIVTGSGVR